MDSPPKRNDLLLAVDIAPKQVQFPQLTTEDVTIPSQAWRIHCFGAAIHTACRRCQQSIAFLEAYATLRTGLGKGVAKEASRTIITPSSTTASRGDFRCYAATQEPADEWPRPHSSCSPLDIFKGMSMMLRVST
jgi:hypothetical protein